MRRRRKATLRLPLSGELRLSRFITAVFLELENCGAQPLPWCAGHHFYFTLPWHPGLSRADYRFEAPAVLHLATVPYNPPALGGVNDFAQDA